MRGPCKNGTSPCPNDAEALEDAPSNTWSGLRILNATHDIVCVRGCSAASPAAPPGSSHHCSHPRTATRSIGATPRPRLSPHPRISQCAFEQLPRSEKEPRPRQRSLSVRTPALHLPQRPPRPPRAQGVRHGKGPVAAGQRGAQRERGRLLARDACCAVSGALGHRHVHGGVVPVTAATRRAAASQGARSKAPRGEQRHWSVRAAAAAALPPHMYARVWLPAG